MSAKAPTVHYEGDQGWPLCRFIPRAALTDFEHEVTCVACKRKLGAPSRRDRRLAIGSTARRYLAAVAALNAEPKLTVDLPDDHPVVVEFFAAHDAFTEAVGFGFAADISDVAELLGELL